MQVIVAALVFMLGLIQAHACAEAINAHGGCADVTCDSGSAASSTSGAESADDCCCQHGICLHASDLLKEDDTGATPNGCDSMPVHARSSMPDGPVTGIERPPQLS